MREDPYAPKSDAEVNRLYAEALAEFRFIFEESPRLVRWLYFASDPSDYRRSEGYQRGGDQLVSIQFPVSKSIGENSIRLVVKSWLRDGFLFRGTSRDPLGKTKPKASA
jgi:hypothetical protein